MLPVASTVTPRRREILERAYAYVLANGLSGMSLRPLATAVGSSPRVLLFLFESKDGLIRALLARARADELDLLASLDARQAPDLHMTATAIWRWLSAPAHRGLLTLWTESYARSLLDPTGPWADFAAGTVQDWLALLARAQPPARRRTRAGERERTLVLALLRGALLDLLATGEEQRVEAAVREGLPAITTRRWPGTSIRPAV
jgi:AcrR family transcriptional regulator